MTAYEFLYVADTVSGTESIGQCQRCFALVCLDFGSDTASSEHTQWHTDRDKAVRVAAMGFGL